MYRCIVRYLYFYAEKYQVDDLKTKLIRDVFFSTEDAFTSQDLQDGLFLGSEYGIPGIVNSLDEVELDLTIQNVDTFWKIAADHKMDGLMNQVAEFVSMKPIKKRWPRDMIVHIHNFNRKKIEESKRMWKLCIKKCAEEKVAETRKWKTKFRQLRSHYIYRPWYCRHLPQRYKPINECGMCTAFVDQLVSSEDED